MKTCTFFGSRSVPAAVKTPLDAEIAALIDEGFDTFYVGNQGEFDAMVLGVLREMAAARGIRYAVVLAYHPSAKQPGDFVRPEETMLPEEVAAAHPRFAIAKRNRWMLAQADAVIACPMRAGGGADKFTALAESQGKRVIRLR